MSARFRPVCFMVMPFGTKPVEPRPDKALAPAIEELGYDPMGADQETGAQRQALAGLLEELRALQKAAL